MINKQKLSKMKTPKAIALYNAADKKARRLDTSSSFFKRADDINNILINKHGEEAADDIHELVFQHEIGWKWNS